MVTTGIKKTVISPTKKVGRNRQVGQQHQPTWGRQNLWYAFSQDGRVYKAVCRRGSDALRVSGQGPFQCQEITGKGRSHKQEYGRTQS